MDRFAEQRRQWTRDNRDRMRELQYRWRDANPEKARKATADWKKRNPERAKGSWQRWKQAHPERAKAGMERFHAQRPWYKSLAATKARAKKKRMPCRLTAEWAQRVWTGRCALTGLPFIPGDQKDRPYSASIDRIDPRKGYTPDNCRFILNCINTFKGRMSDEQVLTVARAICSPK